MTTTEMRRTITHATNPAALLARLGHSVPADLLTCPAPPESGHPAGRAVLAPSPQSLAPASPVPQSLSPLVPAHRDSHHGEHKFPPLRGAIA